MHIVAHPSGVHNASAPLYARPLSPAQLQVVPLQPVFAACRRRGLPTCEASRIRRLYAVNRYCAFLPFTFIESFKEMLTAENRGMVEVVADAIEEGRLQW